MGIASRVGAVAWIRRITRVVSRGVAHARLVTVAIAVRRTVSVTSVQAKIVEGPIAVVEPKASD